MIPAEKTMIDKKIFFIKDYKVCSGKISGITKSSNKIEFSIIDTVIKNFTFWLSIKDAFESYDDAVIGLNQLIDKEIKTLEKEIEELTKRKF